MSFIIKSPDDLKDPFLCYCIFERFDKEAGEDYMDYNENIINIYPFMFWMLGKGYITNEHIEGLLKEDKEHLDFYGWGISTISDVLNSEVLFPKTYGQSGISCIKVYTILAEYMSICNEFRTRLYNSVNNKATAFSNNEFYKDENGISLACIIKDEDLVANETYTKEMIESIMKTSAWKIYDLTLRERYESAVKLTIEEADNMGED